MDQNELGLLTVKEKESLTDEHRRGISCPLTGRLFFDPIKITGCGHVFEKEALLQKIQEPGGATCCPMCGGPIESDNDLQGDIFLKQKIKVIRNQFPLEDWYISFEILFNCFLGKYRNEDNSDALSLTKVSLGRLLNKKELVLAQSNLNNQDYVLIAALQRWPNLMPRFLYEAQNSSALAFDCIRRLLDLAVFNCNTINASIHIKTKEGYNVYSTPYLFFSTAEGRNILRSYPDLTDLIVQHVREDIVNQRINPQSSEGVGSFLFQLKKNGEIDNYSRSLHNFIMRKVELQKEWPDSWNGISHYLRPLT